MAGADLQSILPIVNGRVTLDANTLPGSNLGALLTAWTGGALVIENAKPQAGAARGHVAISGTANCFGLNNVPATVTLDRATPTDAAIILAVRFQLDSMVTGNWHFSQFFAALPHPPGSPQSASPLDALAFKTAALLLATDTTTDPGTSATVAPGLSFAGTLAGATIQGLPIALGAGMVLTGVLTPERIGVATPRRLMEQFPWDVTAWPVPGIVLTASFGAGAKLGPIPVTHPAMRIYSPITAKWAAMNRSYVPVVAFTADVAVGSSGSVHLAAQIDANGHLALTGDGNNITLQSLADLAGLGGGADVTKSLPDHLGGVIAAAKQLQLEAVSLGGTLTKTQYSFDFAALRVGYPQLNWPIWDSPHLEVDSLSVEFELIDPLGPGRAFAACVMGTLTIGGVALELYTTVPDFSVVANLPDGVTLPLHALTNFAGLPDLPDLTVSSLTAYFQPRVAFGMQAALAPRPGWTLDLGFLKLTAQSITVDINKPSGGAVSGSISGTILLWDGAALEIAYSTPGQFQANATVPTIHMSTLWRWLDGIGIVLPFPDIELDQLNAAITIQSGDYSFVATTMVAGFGELAFATRKAGGSSGIAVGIAISDPQSPSLGFVGEILALVNLQKMVLVVSSLNDTGFTFPDLSVFNAPSFAGKGVKLPAGGVVKGVNFFAQLGTTGDKGLGALFKLFGVKVDGSLSVTLSVSVPDPKTNSKLFLDFRAHEVGLDFEGELGLLMTGGEPGAFVAAKATTTIQGNPVTFVIVASVFETGVLLSGTMIGTITFGPVHLTDLAIMLGVDFAGLPSVGFAAQVEVSDFDSSLVIFLDSVNPAQSMFAGAVSDISLDEVVNAFTGGVIPSALTSVLPTLALKGIESFDVPAAGLAAALDSQDHAAIATALNGHGLNLGATVDSFHVIVATKGQHWFIAHRGRDGQNRPLPHYELSLNGANVTCKLEAQVYFAPQATTVGALSFDAGCYIAAELDNMLLSAKIDINIDTSRGISADVDLDKIQLFSSDFLVIAAATGDGGPHLSLSTYSNPQQSDPRRRDPHILIDGKLRILGIDVSSSQLTLGADGLDFSFSQNGVLGGLTLAGTVDTHALAKMHASGTVSFGFDKSFSIAGLDLHLQAMATGKIAVDLNGGTPKLTLDLGIAFMGLSLNLPEITLSASVFGDIPKMIYDQVSDAIGAYLKNMLGIAGGALKIAQAAASALGTELKDAVPLLQNLGASASDVASAISGVYHLNPGQVASALLDLGKLSVQQVSIALKVGLNLAADGVAGALNTAGVAADAIAGALSSGFGLAADGVASVLNDIGLPGSAIAGALKSAFNVSVDEMASILKDTLGYGADAARAVLTGVGYAADAVEGALSSAWDWASDNLNPSNW